MLIRFSNNPFRQVYGIAVHNSVNIFLFILIGFLATLQYHYLELFAISPMTLPVVPVSILGGALAIFLGFRNNSAYDRWWEARKIWGGVVNASRTFGMMITSFSSTVFSENKVSQKEIDDWQESIIYRHIAWLYSLKMHLRKLNYWEDLEKYLSREEVEEIKKFHNKPTQLLKKQGKELQFAFENKLIEDFRHMELSNVLKEFYTLQGQAERIKGTIFPFYYNYFTGVFLWLFIICLPFTLVPQMGWATIPMSFAISFVFKILDKSGAITEDPFEGRAADTPISSITRNIEIDLLEMIGSKTIPAPIEPKTTKHGVLYLD
jgi:ion channel-forming bestrophin family protein